MHCNLHVRQHHTTLDHSPFGMQIGNLLLQMIKAIALQNGANDILFFFKKNTMNLTFKKMQIIIKLFIRF